MKFKYTGDCAAGQVRFSRPNEAEIVMPKGEAVECPDWLAEKLANNSHFEAVNDSSGASSSPSEVADDKSIKPGMGECPDCSGIFRLRKDGYLYAHVCNGG